MGEKTQREIFDLLTKKMIADHIARLGAPSESERAKLRLASYEKQLAALRGAK
jgi:hypothetical protein